MEIYLIFIFFILSIILSVFAYLFETRAIMIGSAIILILLSFSVVGDGYSLENSQTSSIQPTYIYNSTTNTHLLSQINVSSSVVATKTQGNFSYALGLIIFGFGAVSGILAYKG